MVEFLEAAQSLTSTGIMSLSSMATSSMGTTQEPSQLILPFIGPPGATIPLATMPPHGALPASVPMPSNVPSSGASMASNSSTPMPSSAMPTSVPPIMQFFGGAADGQTKSFNDPTDTQIDDLAFKIKKAEVNGSY